jgi:hypothetical protein
MVEAILLARIARTTLVAEQPPLGLDAEWPRMADS